MTTPPPQDPYGSDPYSSDPYAPQPPYSPAPPPPAYGHPPPPAAGFGAPTSDKSKVAAGLLQLLPGLCLLIGGIGRLYAGHTTIGIVQLASSFVAWASLVCGFFIFIPWVFTFGIWVWFIVDGIVILVSQSTDGEGRPLRA